MILLKLGNFVIKFESNSCKTAQENQSLQLTVVKRIPWKHRLFECDISIFNFTFQQQWKFITYLFLHQHRCLDRQQRSCAFSNWHSCLCCLWAWHVLLQSLSRPICDSLVSFQWGSFLLHRCWRMSQIRTFCERFIYCLKLLNKSINDSYGSFEICITYNPTQASKSVIKIFKYWVEHELRYELIRQFFIELPM